MNHNEIIYLSRDVEVSMIPAGDKVTLAKGVPAYITQSLGGSYTVVVNGNMFRIESEDADVLGIEPEKTPAETASKATNKEELDKQILAQLKTVYDPEIPVNLADLGLIYSREASPICDKETFKPTDDWRIDVKMTLTAPGCGMGPTLQEDVKNKLLCIKGVDEVNVELVWDPPWGREMMSDEAKLQLGMM
jgi:probable FeS assembly SUF system protein SufT